MSNKTSSSLPPPPQEFANLRLWEEMNELKEQVDTIVRLLRARGQPQNCPNQDPPNLNNRRPSPPPRTPPRAENFEEPFDHDNDSNGSEMNGRRSRRFKDDDKGLKIDIPEFEGSFVKSSRVLMS